MYFQSQTVKLMCINESTGSLLRRSRELRIKTTINKSKLRIQSNRNKGIMQTHKYKNVPHVQHLRPAIIRILSLRKGLPKPNITPIRNQKKKRAARVRSKVKYHSNPEPHKIAARAQSKVKYHSNPEPHKIAAVHYLRPDMQKKTKNKNKNWALKNILCKEQTKHLCEKKRQIFTV